MAPVKLDEERNYEAARSIELLVVASRILQDRIFAP